MADRTGYAPPMLPTHVQQRADAQLGTAWRRCEALLSDDDAMALHRWGTDSYFASTDEHETGFFETPLAALGALAEELEADREAESL